MRRTIQRTSDLRRRVKLLKYLANLGYGSRRHVAELFVDGRVRHVDGHLLHDGDVVGLDDVRVDGAALDPAPGVVIMLHKPVDCVCSTQGEEPIVYQLLPSRFVLRTPVIAPVGRLDRDTSGLLLLTDNGALNHRLTSPRAHVPKTYTVILANDLRGDEQARLAAGTLMLESEHTPLKPAALDVLSARHVRVTVTEGRYHHVRRMFAALGNHVIALHRESVGPLTLAGLPVGAWRALTTHEVARLNEPSLLRGR